MLERTLNTPTSWSESALDQLYGQNYTPNLCDPYIPLLNESVVQGDM